MLMFAAVVLSVILILAGLAMAALCASGRGDRDMAEHRAQPAAAQYPATSRNAS